MLARPTTLYRAHGRGGGHVIYVGIAYCYKERLRQHRLYSRWWDDAVFFSISHFPDRASAAKAELEEIAARRPPFNIVGHPNRRRDGSWVFS